MLLKVKAESPATRASSLQAGLLRATGICYLGCLESWAACGSRFHTKLAPSSARRAASGLAPQAAGQPSSSLAAGQELRFLPAWALELLWQQPLSVPLVRGPGCSAERALQQRAHSAVPSEGAAAQRPSVGCRQETFTEFTRPRHNCRQCCKTYSVTASHSGILCRYTESGAGQVWTRQEPEEARGRLGHRSV